MAYAAVNSPVWHAAQSGTMSFLQAGTMVATTGNTIVVFVIYYYDLTTDTGTFTVSDGATPPSTVNTYTEATQAHVQDTTDLAAMRVFYSTNITGGSLVPTINFPNANFHFVDIMAMEYSGLATSSIYQGGSGRWQTSSAGTGANAVTSNAFTIAVQPCALIGVTYLDSASDGPPIYGTDVTYNQRGTFWGNPSPAEGALEDVRITSTGSYSAKFAKTASTGFTLTTAIALAEPGASGGGGVTITPTVGALTVTGNSATVTNAQNTVITPIVARRRQSGLVVPDRRLVMPSRKIFLPTRRRAA